MKTILLALTFFGSALLCASQVESDIKYYLYTSKNKGMWQGQTLTRSNPNSVKNSNFDGSKPTSVLVHGWYGGVTESYWNNRLKNAILSKHDVNVIIVDWSKLAHAKYEVAARNTRFVGRKIARLAEFLEYTAGTSRKKMHFIGHSLGGQTVGTAGRNLNPRPARVTGLDTAERQFNSGDRNDYLNPTDADFVDEIYGKVSTNNLVKGHANFYPNGGHDAHMDIPEYLIASVYGGWCSYPAFSCASWAQFTTSCRNSDGNHMGYYAVKPANGQRTSYYLAASKTKPC